MEEGFKYHIPEEIPANERTAFHGAAAAAAKSGKKKFNFGGKTHPVTMKKDTANAITSSKHHNKDDKMKKESTMTFREKLIIRVPLHQRNMTKNQNHLKVLWT